MPDYIAQLKLPNNSVYNLRAIAANFSATKNGVAYYSDTTGTFASTSAGTSGYILIGQGANSAPTWQEILPIAHGGTNTDSITTNRLLYVKTADNVTSFTSSSHFINTTTSGNTTTSVLGINAESVESGYVLNINGNTYSNGNIIPSLNNTTADKTLGSSTNAWAAVYVDTTNNGDEYTPIYWANGKPTAAKTIQQASFSLTTANSGSVTISTNTSTNSIVTQIVVVEDSSSKISNLKSKITWSSNTGSIVLSAAIDGTVNGYILYTK